MPDSELCDLVRIGHDRVEVVAIARGLADEQLAGRFAWSLADVVAKRLAEQVDDGYDDPSDAAAETA